MTTLYDPPASTQTHDTYYITDTEGEDTDGEEVEFELAEYDLDVVDDALLNPHSSEYFDHFGFKIQVKTDDESSSDDDSEFSDQEAKATTTATTLASDDDSRVQKSAVPVLQPISKPSKKQRSSSVSSYDSALYIHARRSSATSINSPIPRPSQSYQQRQKHYTEAYSFIGIPKSPTTNDRCFDRLALKFRRFSHSDHRYDSDNHTRLKQEALGELRQCKEKGGIQNNSINWDFWSLVIQNFGRVIECQMDDLRHHLTKGGIPPPIRGLVWQIIAKSSDLETEYRELLKSSSPFEKQITRDLTRTFPNHPYFMQESGRHALFNVAKAYSLFDQEVGYCQGLAFIIGCLLLHMSEERSFCVLIQLMGKYGLRGHFTPQMEVLHQHMYQFDHVFQQKLPVVHRYMDSEGVTPSMYASQWFITLFSLRCPLELSFRVIDLLLVEGTQVLIQIALALIIRNQEKILKLGFESLVDFLCHGVFEIFGQDGDGFVEDTYRVDLPARFMARLAKQYAGEEMTRDSRSTSQEDNLRRINGQLLEHIRSVESQLRLLQSENKEMTQEIIDSKMEIARNEDEKQELRHELTQTKTEFEVYKKDILLSYEKQMNELLANNKLLEEKNQRLSNQLTETESFLIDMKMSIAEREIEFESLKRQLKEIKSQ